MHQTTYEERRQLESLDADALADHQLARLNAMLEAILPANAFYSRKLAGLTLPLTSLDQMAELPTTSKDELVGDDPEGYPANLTFARSHYIHFHRTSGTSGRPLIVLDGADDWQWWLDCWQFVLDAAEIGPRDVALMAFSFGPFIGFWSAHDAVRRRGCLTAPSGGMTTLERIELARASRATCLFCTPSYALRMAEVAGEHGVDLTSLGVRRIVVAGEPGGSIPSVRGAIESAWNAQVIDHAGASEVGPWGFADRERRGLHVLESEFVAELLPVEGAADQTLRELTLTTLGRIGAPVIRYRTGDLVRATRPTDGPCRFLLLEGGVFGRADDMLIVRGVNVFPSSIDAILREFPEVAEYRITAERLGALDQLSVEVEDRLGQPERIAEALRLRLGLRVAVQSVPLGTLPRFEGKGKRFSR